MEDKPAMLTQSISDALAKIDPEYAAEKLGSLDKKDKKENYFLKRDAGKAGVAVLAAMLEEIKKDGRLIENEDIKYMKIEKLEIGGRQVLDDETKKEATRMMEDIYSHIFRDEKTRELNIEAYDSVIEEFKDYMFTPGKMDGEIVFTLKFQNKLVGLLRFRSKEGETETMLAKSLIIDEKTQKLSLGNYFQKSALELMRQNFKIEAITRVDNPANGKYKKLGFIFDQKTFIKNGVEYYNITLPKQEQLKEAA
jgi:predicted GNAT family N-acyltransferase